VNCTYDLDSRLTQVSDPTGTYSFTFDNMGRLIGTATSYTFLPGRNFTTSYTYDKASNRAGFTDPEGGSTTYVYDTLHRLQTLTPPTAFGSGSFGFSYDALSRRTQMTRPNNVTTNYAYDNLSRLTSVLHQLAGSTIDGATYTVDNAGNRTSKTDMQTGVTTNYGYDNIYQLLSATQGASTTESYTYDPVGNRLSDLTTSGWSNNTSNELTSRPGVSYTFDNNGNTLTKADSTGTTTYAWDFENRLTSVTLPGSGGTVSFKYDPFGHRIYKSSSTGTSIYAYDGDDLIEETNASGGVVARYTHTTDKIDEPAAMLRSGATSYYQADGLGSITSLSSTAGALAQTYTFDSFGKQISSSGSLINPFQFTSRELDTETNLYYFRARYYDPTVGHFLGEDPVRSPVKPNRYTYVRNSPLNRIDSSGMTDQPPYPPGMWGKYRGCKLVSSFSLTLWTSQTGQTPTSDWRFVTSFQEGPEFDPEFGGIPAAVITCVWERTYSAELWGHVLTTYTWRCWSNSCWGYNEFTTHTFKWSLKDLGKTTGTERTTTQRVWFGAEDETNDILCVTDPRLRP